MVCSVRSAKQHQPGGHLVIARLVILSLIVLASLAAAADLDSDRPGLVVSPEVLPRGVWQIESGVTRTSDGPAHLLAVGEAVVRIGVNERAEFRVIPPSYLHLTVDGLDESQSGQTDSAVGLKLASPNRAGRAWRIALMSHLILPTGDPGLARSELGVDIFLISAWRLASTLDLTFNGGVVATEGAHSSLQYGMLQIEGALSPRLALFAGARVVTNEFHRFLGHGATGLVYRAAEGVLLDLRLGMGLDAPVDEETSVGLGITWRP
jgi:hypothetical protein